MMLEQYPGLPDISEGGKYIGFSADGRHFVLTVFKGAWIGVGFQEEQTEYTLPFAFVAVEEMAGFIVSHMKVAL